MKVEYIIIAALVLAALYLIWRNMNTNRNTSPVVVTPPTPARTPAEIAAASAAVVAGEFEGAGFTDSPTLREVERPSIGWTDQRSLVFTANGIHRKRQHFETELPRHRVVDAREPIILVSHPRREGDKKRTSIKVGGASADAGAAASTTTPPPAFPTADEIAEAMARRLKPAETPKPEKKGDDEASSPDDKRTVWIGRLPDASDEASVETLVKGIAPDGFESVGTVRIAPGKGTWAFVVYADEKAAQAAVKKLNGADNGDGGKLAAKIKIAKK